MKHVYQKRFLLLASIIIYLTLDLPQHALYDFLSRGHRVLRPTVCPASPHVCPFRFIASTGIEMEPVEDAPPLVDCEAEVALNDLHVPTACSNSCMFWGIDLPVFRYSASCWVMRLVHKYLAMQSSTCSMLQSTTWATSARL